MADDKPTTNRPRAVVVQELLQIIEAVAPANDIITRSRPEGALDHLLQSILDVGTVALTEDQAHAAYDVGAKAINKALYRFAREADRIARAASRARTAPKPL